MLFRSNAGYTYDAQLLERLADAFGECRVTVVDANDLALNFDELTLDEREATFDFVRLADVVLQSFRCAAVLRRFAPAELPTLYTTNDAATFLRSVDQSREVADDLWGGILENVAADSGAGALTQLCFNYNNAMVRRLTQIRHKTLIRRAVEMLYVQALLLGHIPLQAREMSVLNDGLLGLIELGLSGVEKK